MTTRTTRLDDWGPLGLILATIAAVLLALAGLVHADPLLEATAPPPASWILQLDPNTKIALWIAAGYAILRGVLEVLKVVAPLTTTKRDDDVRDALAEVLRQNIAPLGPVTPLQRPPGSSPGRVRLVLAMVLTVAGAGALGALGVNAMAGCSVHDARVRGANGLVAFLDCEAAQLPADTLADATALASAAIWRGVAGSGQVDTTRVVSDLRPLHSNLAICAAVAALAAAKTPTPPAPGAPMTAELVVDAQGIDAVLSQLHAEGWPRVRLASGAVL